MEQQGSDPVLSSGKLNTGYPTSNNAGCNGNGSTTGIQGASSNAVSAAHDCTAEYQACYCIGGERDTGTICASSSKRPRLLRRMAIR